MAFRIVLTRKALGALGGLDGALVKSVVGWLESLADDARPAGTREHEGLRWNNEADPLQGCTVYWQVIESRQEVVVAWVQAPSRTPPSKG